MNALKSAHGRARDLVDSGVEVFFILDFDDVFNPSYASGKFGKDYFNPTQRIRYSNPFYKEPETRAREYSKRIPKRYSIQFSGDLVKNFRRILRDPKNQVVWLTTWRQHMGGVCATMNFTAAREMLYLPWGDDDPLSADFGNHDLKAGALKEFFKPLNDAPDDSKPSVIWIEDETSKSENLSRLDFDPDKVFSKGKSLLIVPNPLYGVSRAEFASVADFIGVGESRA